MSNYQNTLEEDDAYEVPVPVVINWSDEARQFLCGPVAGWFIEPLLTMLGNKLRAEGYVEFEVFAPLYERLPNEQEYRVKQTQKWRHPEAQTPFTANVSSAVTWTDNRMKSFRIDMFLVTEDVGPDFLEGRIMATKVVSSEVSGFLHGFPEGNERLQAWHDSYNRTFASVTPALMETNCQVLMDKLAEVSTC